MTFALTLVPLLWFMGAAVDYSRAAKARTAMQAALDSTSLMLSKDLSSGIITTSQINSRAQAYFAALYTIKDAQQISVSASYTEASGGGGSTIQVTGSGLISTGFMKVAGIPTMKLNASSTATWEANDPHNDNYGSPVDARMIKLCANKNRGVTVFIVRTDGGGRPAVVPACATGSSNSFRLTPPGQTGAVSPQLGVEIPKLHVSR